MAEDVNIAVSSISSFSSDFLLRNDDDDEDADRGRAFFDFLDDDEATSPRGRPDDFDGVVVAMMIFGL